MGVTRCPKSSELLHPSSTKSYRIKVTEKMRQHVNSILSSSLDSRPAIRVDSENMSHTSSSMFHAFKMVSLFLAIANTCWVGYACNARVEDEFARHHVSIRWGFRGTPTASVLEHAASARPPSLEYPVEPDLAHVDVDEPKADNWAEEGAEAPPAPIPMQKIPRSGLSRETENIVRMVFVILFNCVLGVQLYTKRWSFFQGGGGKWRRFDFVVMSIASGDLAISSVVLGRLDYTLPDLTFLLVLRFFRQLFDLLNHGSTHFIRILGKSVLNSFQIVWAAIAIIMVVVCLFAISFEQGVSRSLGLASVGSLEEGDLLQLAETYGSLPIALLSLFMAISGGMDWADFMQPLRALPPIYTALFLAFISFLVIGILNVVTGIFVECANTVTMSTRKEKIRNQIRDQQNWVRQIRKIFFEADTDHSGTLSWEEFEIHLEHPIMEAYFKSLELDFSEAKGLFILLDVRGTGEVLIDDFVKGCLLLRGEAKSMDLATLRYEFLRASESWRKFMEQMSKQLSDMQGSLAALCDEVYGVYVTADSQATIGSG